MHLRPRRLRALVPLQSVRMSSIVNTRPPLISVIGATGTGKSNLAVDLALALNGEIINADAMQMYEGLPIITNKITTAETKGIPHHLLGFLNVRDAWRVGKFTKEAELIIDSIHTRGKLPILVGGTHYYIQSLLFPHSAPREPPESEDEAYPFPPISKEQLEEKYPILTAPTPDLYSHLQSIDPLIAARWHPNDHRKILRSLQIYYASGRTRTASEVYAAQRSRRTPNAAAAAAVEGKTQWTPYRNLIFWVHAETDALKKRLDQRVDKMINEGMWAEINQMKQTYDAALIHNAAVIAAGRQKIGRSEERHEDDDEVDLGSGIWQSIGFKEFLPYLERRDNSTPALEGAEEAVEKTETQVEAEKIELQTAIDSMKAATRQYARSQIKWIRIKFMNALQPSTHPESKNGDIFLLDSTDALKFTENVSSKGVEIAKDFLLNKPLPDPLALSHLASTSLPPKRSYDFSQRPDLWVQRVCELCRVTCINEDQWMLHERSQRHKKAVSREKKRPEVEAFIRMRKEAEAKKKEELLRGAVGGGDKEGEKVEGGNS